MKKRKSYKIIAGAIAMLFTILSLNLANNSTVNAKSVNSIIDNIYISHENGSTENPWSRYEQAKVNMEWSIPNNTVKSGDTATFTLPSLLKLTKNLSFSLIDENSVAPDNVVGNVFVDQATGIVTVTFSNYVESHSNIHGTMWFLSNFRGSEMHDENTFTFQFVDSDGVAYEQELDFEAVTENPDEVINKYGSFAYPDNPEKIQWYTRVNASHATIPKAVLTDTIGEYHELVIDSLIIYKVDYQIENDKVIISNHVDVTADFSVTQTAGGFTINFGDINGEGYLLRYDTQLTSEVPVGTYIRNSVAIVGEDTETYTSQNTVRFSAGGGTGEGVTGRIALLKSDSKTGELLAGAEFLIVPMGETESVGTIVTDSNGYGISGELTFGTYLLLETKAPEGYKLLQSPVIVELNDSETVEVNVENYAITGSLQIKKVDAATGLPLGGAEFTISLADGTPVYENLISDENGIINVDELPIGDYQLIETKAPAGYLLDATPYLFSISAEDPQVVVVRENVPEPPLSDTIENTTTNNNLPNTGNSTAEIAIGGALIMVLSLGALFIKRKNH